MADVQWIKMLAGSTFSQSGQEWILPESFSGRKSQSEREYLAISALYEEAKEAVFCYNNFVSKSREISILTLEEGRSDRLNGFVFLMCNQQLKLIRRAEGFELSILSVKHYGTNQKIIETIFPCYDTFGSLFWQTQDQRATLTTEHIVKTALKELIKFVDSTKG
jgi:hypothetical protein